MDGDPMPAVERAMKAPVDQGRLTEIGRALAQLGIEHIPSYCPQGRGRMERFFGSWPGRLPQELGRAGITDRGAANFTCY